MKYLIFKDNENRKIYHSVKSDSNDRSEKSFSKQTSQLGLNMSPIIRLKSKFGP